MKLNNKNKTIFNQSGAMIMLTLVFTSIFITMMSGMFSLFIYQNRLAKKLQAKEAALQVAEAGINYYRWHLAHDENDYADGTDDVCANPNSCGPYEHDYYDPLGGKLGTFSLLITPPPTGSTVVTINSTGWVDGFANQSRIIEVKYGIPSLAQYAVVTNNYSRFGSGTTIYGPMHSNSGLRFDGVAYNLVTSAVSDYDDPDHSGDNEFGVHTHVSPTDPLPPAAVPARPDVFVAGREFPITIIDFNSISADLSTLLETAGEDTNCNISNKGCVVQYSGSSNRGWHIQFLGNGTFRYRKVKSTRICAWWYWDDGWHYTSVPAGDIYQYRGNWTTLNLPNNGIIFVRDNVWVDGAINGNNITVVAAEEFLTTGDSKIWINNDLLYTNKDGTDTIGLIAQDDISVGIFSEDDLEIDAALISQKGRIGREYYPSLCNSTYYKRDTITIYGALITNQRYGFSWGCGGEWCSGYDIRNLTYDNNLTYGPPPSFPATGQYTFISWEEKLAGEL